MERTYPLFCVPKHQTHKILSTHSFSFLIPAALEDTTAVLVAAGRQRSCWGYPSRPLPASHSRLHVSCSEQTFHPRPFITQLTLSFPHCLGLICPSSQSRTFRLGFFCGLQHRKIQISIPLFPVVVLRPYPPPPQGLSNCRRHYLGVPLCLFPPCASSNH